MENIIGDYEAFIKNISSGLMSAGIERDELAMMDHLCYRVETVDRYIAIRDALGAVATLLDVSVVAGRNIATFELNEYIKTDGWTVPYLELPEPKEGSLYKEGLEHAELIVIGSLDRFAKKHTSLPFEIKGMAKSINPELGLKTDQISVKFHEQSLGSVVRTEQRIKQQ